METLRLLSNFYMSDSLRAVVNMSQIVQYSHTHVRIHNVSGLQRISKLSLNSSFGGPFHSSTDCRSQRSSSEMSTSGKTVTGFLVLCLVLLAKPSASCNKWYEPKGNKNRTYLPRVPWQKYFHYSYKKEQSKLY